MLCDWPRRQPRPLGDSSLPKPLATSISKTIELLIMWLNACHITPITEQIKHPRWPVSRFKRACFKAMSVYFQYSSEFTFLLCVSVCVHKHHKHIFQTEANQQDRKKASNQQWVRLPSFSLLYCELTHFKLSWSWAKRHLCGPKGSEAFIVDGFNTDFSPDSANQTG